MQPLDGQPGVRSVLVVVPIRAVLFELVTLLVMPFCCLAVVAI
jgi:hypothetical protein